MNKKTKYLILSAAIIFIITAGFTLRKALRDDIIAPEPIPALSLQSDSGTATFPREYTLSNPVPEPSVPVQTVTATQPDRAAALFDPGADFSAKNPQDILKVRYENLFVNFFILEKCKRVDALDYHIINSALLHELSSLSLPARLQYDILTAATGTYQEVYASMKCSGDAVKNIVGAYYPHLTTLKQLRFP